MATIREYFEKDLAGCFRVYCTLPHAGEEVEAIILYDLSVAMAYISLFVPSRDEVGKFCKGLLSSMDYGNIQLRLSGEITLPAPMNFPGEVRIENKPGEFELGYRLFGDPRWRSTKDVTSTMRVFIYSESDLPDEEIIELQKSMETKGFLLQFRGEKYLMMRRKFDVPLAFICHDSRDNEDVARPIAGYLQQQLCPVWYDEFSLPVGANLRRSIEKGLKECKKCILVLSPFFFNNSGWTRKEFDSVFTREILEGQGIVLPVWHNVSKEAVHEYSPSLLNVKGLDWSLGEEEVCRKLHAAIVA